jgi:hypothetical protein
LLNDDTKKNTEGNANNNSFVEFNPFLSSGNNKVKNRKAVGMIPAVAKLILPQNNNQGVSFKAYSIKRLSPHAAADQERTENAKFARL